MSVITGSDTSSVFAPSVGLRALKLWLFAVAGLVGLMVVVGGITRLTGSGLSMVEWRPLMGTLPPLTDAEWNRVFSLYRQSPEYLEINTGMTLAEFKRIFFWEFFHRLLGRLIGLAYGLPLLGFMIFRAVPPGMLGRLLLLLLLGGLQGGIGWWMVTSGLADDPMVSQYRLAVHLGMALLIFGLLLWTALDLADGPAPAPFGVSSAGYPAFCLVLLGLTILAGAFVAGLDGGLLYNEYPLMGNGLVPIEYGEMGLLDAFENPASAQLHHRLLALTTVVAIAGLWWYGLKAGLASRSHVVLAAVLLQFLLGIITLLHAVPVSLGTMHQGGAVVLLGSVLWLVHGLSRRHSRLQRWR